MRALILLIFALLSCPFAQAADENVELGKLEAIDRFAWDGPLFLKAESEKDVRKLGEVRGESSEVVPNPHVDGTIKYTKLEFKGGLKIFFRTVGPRAVVQFLSVTVSSPKWPIKSELNVGAPLARVLTVLGAPNERKGEEVVYFGMTEQVIFRINNERVSEVEFSYYAD